MYQANLAMGNQCEFHPCLDLRLRLNSSQHAADWGCEGNWLIADACSIEVSFLSNFAGWQLHCSSCTWDNTCNVKHWRCQYLDWHNIQCHLIGNTSQPQVWVSNQKQVWVSEYSHWHVSAALQPLL
jgi:hypothetical protein